MLLLRLMICLALVPCSPVLLGAEDALPEVPDPIGLGPRLALIDYLQEEYNYKAKSGLSLDELKVKHRELYHKKHGYEIAKRRERENRMRKALEEMGYEHKELQGDALAALYREAKQTARDKLHASVAREMNKRIAAEKAAAEAARLAAEERARREREAFNEKVAKETEQGGVSRETRKESEQEAERALTEEEQKLVDDWEGRLEKWRNRIKRRASQLDRMEDDLDEIQEKMEEVQSRISETSGKGESTTTLTWKLESLQKKYNSARADHTKLNDELDEYYDKRDEALDELDKLLGTEDDDEDEKK